MERGKITKIIFFIILIFSAYFLIRSRAVIKKTGTKIVFFGLGKSDSIYIEEGDKSMLIDAGLKEDKERILWKLKKLGVRKLDYLILTHPDKDHIGSASYILEEFEIGQLIQSKHFKASKREKRIARVVEEKNINNLIVKEDLGFDLGGLKVKIFSPKKDKYKKDNDYSLVTLIEDGELNYLFPGDAEKELLDEILELDLPKIDLYKVAHHARENVNSKRMIQKISPEYSVISNIQGRGEVDKYLKEQASRVIYADQEDITFFSDGSKLKIYEK